MGSVAIPRFGGLGCVWEAVCSDSWVWRRFWEVSLGEGLGRSGSGSGRPYVAIPGFGEEVWEVGLGGRI